MVCNKCGANLNEGSKFCTSCGNDLSAVTNEPVIENNVPQQTTTPVEQSQNVPPVNNPVDNTTQPVNATEDKVNIGLAILSWFIPIAGLIVFCVKKNTSPKTAKVSGICALISFILNLLVVGAVILLVVGSLNYAVIEADNTANDIIQDTIEENDFQINDSSSAISGDVSEEWKDYQIGISGKTYKIPMTYKELSTATGFTIKDTYSNTTIPTKHYTSVNLYMNDKLALYTEITNNTGTDMKYTDGMVTRVTQTMYQASNGAEKIIFPGGIKVGDTITETEINLLYGTPNDVKTYGTSTQYIYLSDTTWTTTDNFKITVKDGVIDEIQLDNRSAVF